MRVGVPPATRINPLGTGEAVTLRLRDTSTPISQDGAGPLRLGTGCSGSSLPRVFFRNEQLSRTMLQEVLHMAQP